MGICYTSKAFEISRETRERMENEHYYIDMDCGGIIFDDEIPYVIKNAREYGSSEWFDFTGCSDEEILNELSIIDCEDPDGWGYGIGDIHFYETRSGDIVCIVNYAW